MKITGVGAPRIPIQEPKTSEMMGGVGVGSGAGPANSFADKLANAVDNVSDKQLVATTNWRTWPVARTLTFMEP